MLLLNNVWKKFVLEWKLPLLLKDVLSNKNRYFVYSINIGWKYRVSWSSYLKSNNLVEMLLLAEFELGPCQEKTLEISQNIKKRYDC